MKTIPGALRAAAVCLLTTLAAQAATGEPTISGAESGWSAMKKCAAIQDADARHLCSDNVLRDAGLMAPREVARRKEFGLERPAPAEAPPAKVAKAAKVPEPAQAAPPREEEMLEVTLASVDKGNDGKLLLKTTDGALWRQLENEVLRPLPTQGQTMAISKGKFGGYFCKLGKWTAFRCSRTR